jgi:hypothetical protein
MTLEWKKKIVFVHNPLGEQSVFRTIFSFYPVCTRIHPRIRYFFRRGSQCSSKRGIRCFERFRKCNL